MLFRRLAAASPEDFTTGSWSVFGNPAMRLIMLNAARYDATKHHAVSAVGDAQVGLTELSAGLGDWRAPDAWRHQAAELYGEWNKIVDRATERDGYERGGMGSGDRTPPRSWA